MITKDRGVGILATLSGFSEYGSTTFPLLFEQLRTCVAKQLPMYAEKAAKSVNSGNKELLISLIYERFDEVEIDTRKKRLTNLLRALYR